MEKREVCISTGGTPSAVYSLGGRPTSLAKVNHTHICFACSGFDVFQGLDTNKTKENNNMSGVVNCISYCG